MTTKSQSVFETVRDRMKENPALSKNEVFAEIAEATGRSLSSIRANYYKGAHDSGEELLSRGRGRATNGDDPTTTTIKVEPRRRRTSAAAARIAEGAPKLTLAKPGKEIKAQSNPLYGSEIQAALDAIGKLEQIILSQHTKLEGLRKALA